MIKHDLLSAGIVDGVKRENSFRAIRYFFALSLMLVHVTTAMGQAQFMPFTGALCVKAFFVITGFLVLFSYCRSANIATYARKRVFRVLPAYLCVVLMCFLAGALESRLSVAEYFSSGQSYRYLLYNAMFLNFLEPCLPGVFESNPLHAVNGSLWFMKVEVIFYISVPIFVYLLCRFRKWVVLLSVFACSVAYNVFFSYMYVRTGDEMYHLLQRQFLGQLIYFFAGAALLVYFDVFCNYVRWIFPVGILLFVISSASGWLHYVEPVGLAVVIVGVAYYARFLKIFNQVPDLTYGLYLYHFPIAQTVVAHRLHEYSVPLAFLLIFAVTFLMAWLSHRFVESRFKP